MVKPIGTKKTAMGNADPRGHGLGGDEQPMATGGPRPESPPWGPPTGKAGGVTPEGALQQSADARASAEGIRSRVDGRSTTNPEHPKGGQSPPRFYGARGPRDYSRGTSAQGLFRSPGSARRRRVGHCGWNSKPQTVRSAPPGVRAWCRGRRPGAVLFTRSLLEWPQP